MRKCTIVTYAVMLNILLLSNMTLNSESDAELPEWEVGYTWNYQSTGSLPGITMNLTYSIIDTTKINVNGKDYEVYYVNSTSFKNINEINYKEYRDKYISKSDLSIIKIDNLFIGAMGESINREYEFNPPKQEYDFPLYVGKNWTISYIESINIVGEFSTNLSRMCNYTVIEEETVTVAAGSFECYKIESNNGRGIINHIWYSSEVKNIVKHSGQADEIPYEIELASYSLEPKEEEEDDSNPLTSSNYLIPIIIIAIIIVIIVTFFVIQKRKKPKKKKKKGKSKRKSKKKKK